MNPYEDWEKVLKEISGIGRMKLYTGLLGSDAVWVDENTIGIVFREEDEFKKRIVTDDDNTTVISETVKRFTGREIKVVVMNNKEKSSETSEIPEKILDFVKKKGVKLDIIEGSSNAIF